MVTQTEIRFVIKIVGNLSPNFFAVDFNGLLRQALPPFPSSVQVRFVHTAPESLGKNLPLFDTAASKK